MTDADVAEALKNKAWITALFFYFEKTWHDVVRAGTKTNKFSRHQKLRIKNKCIKFVEENFPKQFFMVL